jgi:FtsP/CotA-like multicopper oxidase with cupredoxin domain
VNPIKKDTIIVPVGGYAVIRFFSDNIGFWFFHCHVEVHATEGKNSIFKKKVIDIRLSIF